MVVAEAAEEVEVIVAVGIATTTMEVKTEGTTKEAAVAVAVATSGEKATSLEEVMATRDAEEAEAGTTPTIGAGEVIRIAVAAVAAMKTCDDSAQTPQQWRDERAARRLLPDLAPTPA